MRKRIKFKHIEKYIEELTYIIKGKENTFNKIREVAKKDKESSLLDIYILAAEKEFFNKLNALSDQELHDLLFMIVCIKIYTCGKDIKHNSIKGLAVALMKNNEIYLSKDSLLYGFHYGFHTRFIDEDISYNLVFASMFLIKGYFEKNFLTIDYDDYYFNKIRKTSFDEETVSYTFKIIFNNFDKEKNNFFSKEFPKNFYFFRIENAYFILKNNFNNIEYNFLIKMFKKIIHYNYDEKNIYIKKTMDILYEKKILNKLLFDVVNELDKKLSYFKQYLSEQEYSSLVLLRNL